MNLEPRLLANGSICCEGAYLCNECKAHRAQAVPMTMRAASTGRVASCNCPKCIAARSQAQTPASQVAAAIVRKAIADSQEAKRPGTPKRTYDEWLAHYHIPPDGYGLDRPVAPTDLGPDYQPYGEAPDGYAMALQKRNKETKR